MKRTKPPFRADIVGSFLRTAPLKDARAKHELKQITDAQLKEVEDQEIKKLIKKQEEVGLQLATDGEFRRAWWHFDFFGMLDGVEIAEIDHGIQFKGVQTKHQAPKVTGKIGFSNTHPFIEHFKFVKANTKVTPKMTIPSPTVMHFRLEKDGVDKKFYKNNDDIFEDLGQAYKQAIKGFYDAGCRYLQFDDTAWAYLCSPAELEKAKARGINTATVAKDYAAILNAALEDQFDEPFVMGIHYEDIQWKCPQYRICCAHLADYFIEGIRIALDVFDALGNIYDLELNIGEHLFQVTHVL